MLDRRQTQQNNSSNVVSSSAVDMAKWETDTTNACMKALSQITAATNPSGTSVCYNLLSLDSTPGSGKFMADMRLFQVSTASGDFAGVSAANVAAKVAFSGASVMLVSNTANTGAGMETDLKLLRRQSGAAPMLIRTYMLAGTIDANKLADKVDKGLLESWITPMVTLSATNGLGQQATTRVTSNEAIFVNGVFANDVVLSDMARAQLAVDDAIAALKNGTAAFVVPGVNILIEPIGLYIACVWTIIAFGVYGFGTFERYKHRDAYRTRKARAYGKSGTI
ncbi:uncharacterized protein B0I36DRAFT_238830 [Microdochium trichocladiopsis]|uniref:Uncharacterized protein n=1 Tax=Microdochium trichocladiopsis TaxID=1682393 RepID=A0A9P8YF84_9PEZI|nr:uncharacterized protein B0I36DRAFT_238830 [Microdochium trichocladiopsis]KAH7035898.1 hypothetical protein B0I36DRAFT_238830 [Microdochium trichocladiopsis]